MLSSVQDTAQNRGGQTGRSRRTSSRSRRVDVIYLETSCMCLQHKTFVVAWCMAAAAALLYICCTPGTWYLTSHITHANDLPAFEPHTNGVGSGRSFTGYKKHQEHLQAAQRTNNLFQTGIPGNTYPQNSVHSGKARKGKGKYMQTLIQTFVRSNNISDSRQRHS